MWVMTHYCRCTRSVRHGLEPDIFLLDPPTQSLSKLYFGLVYCNSFNDTDFFPSYCGEYWANEQKWDTWKLKELLTREHNSSLSEMSLYGRHPQVSTSYIRTPRAHTSEAVEKRHSERTSGAFHLSGSSSSFTEFTKSGKPSSAEQ